MAVDFDQFPVDDPIIKSGTNKLSDNWRDFIATFFQTIIGYLTQNGMFMPVLTTTQRNLIQVPQGGQLIYNSTLNSAQYFKIGVGWISF